MKIKPLHDRVVVRRIEEEARTPGGVIIPDTANSPLRKWALARARRAG
jgi:chaperonin GroES